MAYEVNTGIGAVASVQTFVLDGLAPNTSAPVIAGILEDLTTLWCHDYQPALHAAHAAGSGFDDTTLVHADLGNAVGYDGETDLNTAFAKYIDTEF